MGEEDKQQSTSGEASTDIKCLEECPRCRDEGAEGLCGLDSGHVSEHRCNRCSHVWE
jgi:hypothetical protein